MVFKEHGLMLFLSPELQICQIRLQADKGLGRSYAGLLAYIEGMHSLGYLVGDEYENLRQRYSRGLLETSAKPLSLEQLNAKKELERKDQYFRLVSEQWELHPDLNWRLKKFAEAELWKDKVSNAKLVLGLANGQGRA